jgi:hypothetical protein
MQPASCIACKSFVILLSLMLADVLPFALSWQNAQASETAPQQRGEQCRAEEFRAFDFWIGQWTVRLADGREAGKNRISESADGCLIQERWTGARGGLGSSVNFYDPQSRVWRQVWVSGDSIIEISGGLKSASMVLVGEIYDRTVSRRFPFRGRWTLLEDGRVRQFFEERRGDNWEPWFEGFYTKDVE